MKKSSYAATKEVTAILRANHNLKNSDEDDFTVRTPAELISTMSSTSQLLTVLLTAIAAISLLVGGIGIMNIMYPLLNAQEGSVCAWLLVPGELIYCYSF